MSWGCEGTLLACDKDVTPPINPAVCTVNMDKLVHAPVAADGRQTRKDPLPSPFPDASPATGQLVEACCKTIVTILLSGARVYLSIMALPEYIGVVVYEQTMASRQHVGMYCVSSCVATVTKLYGTCHLMIVYTCMLSNCFYRTNACLESMINQLKKSLIYGPGASFLTV
jgi:hypothetical protein